MPTAVQTPTVPTISIVTPSWNQASFLEQTLRSVLDQEGDFRLDYVVMDGGSTDGSVDIIKKYDAALAMGEWPCKCRGIQLRWQSERDGGQSDAINKGLRLARGEIVGWLNSDDTYVAGALAKVCSAFAEDDGRDVVYGKADYVDASGKMIGPYPTEGFSRERLAVSNFICQPSVFLRHAILDRVGLLDASLRYVMDYELWLRLSEQGRFHYVEEILSCYRLHQDSKTMASRHALDNARECLEVVCKYFHRAPANRVYAYCAEWYRSRAPHALLNRKPLEIGLVAPAALLKYAIMNRGIRLEDLKQLTVGNLRCLFKERHPLRG